MREDCDRFRVIAALQPDGELSRLEQTLHRAHAAACGDCRAYAAEIAAITACVRATPPQGLERRILVGTRPLRKRLVSAAAAVAIGVVIAAGLGESQRRGEAAAPDPPAAGDTAGVQKAI